MNALQSHGSSSDEIGRVVVGVDWSPDSDAAVSWAIAHAARTGQPLQFVHVRVKEPNRWEPPAEAEAVVSAALQQAASVPGIRAFGHTIFAEHVADNLLEAAEGATMLVLGAQGHGAVSGVLMGSVSQYVVRHASIPVVTVRVPAHPADAHIVAGIDYSEATDSVLAFAFETASLYAAPLTVIHAWHKRPLHGPEMAVPVPADAARMLAAEQAFLADRLWTWKEKYPNVQVVHQVVPGVAGDVLSGASGLASLVVLGSRGRGLVAGVLLGSVSQKVLHHARCPVAVVP